MRATRHGRALVFAGIAAAVVGAAGYAFSQQGGDLSDDTMRLWRDPSLQGKSHVIHPITAEWVNRLHVIDKKLRGKAKSIDWNLPRGVLVVFYDNTNGTGRQFVIWGNGRRDSLESADFVKRASAWAWAYVDGWEGAPSRIRAGLSARPLMTQHSDKRIVENTLEIHKDVGARDKKPGKDLIKVDAVTDIPEGELQIMPKALDNKASSIRWNFPPGIVVILYDGADGTLRRMPIWGDGVMVNLKPMNNRISAWAWYNVAVDGATPDPH